ncbi:GNAT family N-acetyltransferase [Haliangium sp.]|uniref:bifunctional acetate--CoA ligase family protein/GNAT family N-acetyltransferase n=1 Tax=Haliangium sp. TaxID=2663208 RepID=UPI003D0A9EB7
MSIRNLRYLFRPRSIAVIGAGKRAGSVGAALARNLFGAGFDGPIMPVNPKHAAIEGVLTYPDVASLPQTPDLAVIATPPATVPELIDQLGRRGTRAAIVLTAGFSEGAEGGEGAGPERERAMLAAARPHLVRIVGPNCLGVMAPALGLNASFAHLTARPGGIAFVTQSGAIVTAMLDWAAVRGVGFSALVSLGDMADVDVGDMLDYLADDPATTAILLYVEAVTEARKFMSAARAAARTKPVIVVKAGRSGEGARAAASHTGALAGTDGVYDAVFRRAGMLRVHTLEELYDAAEILATPRLPRGDRLAIITNGGGIGVLATDALIAGGGHLAELPPATVAELDAVLPETWSRHNPVDIIGDASAERYAAALDVLLACPAVDAVLVLYCPTAVTAPVEVAQTVIDTYGRRRAPALLTSWVGAGTAAEARRLFADHHIPSHETPEQAVRAFLHMIGYRRSQEALIETPPSQPDQPGPAMADARAVIEAGLAQPGPAAPDTATDAAPDAATDATDAATDATDATGAPAPGWLDEAAVHQLLGAYGIPVAPTRVVADEDEAAAATAELAPPWVLKLRSPDVVHKSDVGGVVLGLASPQAVRDAAAAMRARLAAARPEARLAGFTVATMIRRRHAFELFLGVTEDPQFGPVIAFGHGGTAVEIIDDKALGLPPLNLHLARELMARTRISRLLGGYRDRPGVDLDAVAMVLVKLSQLVIDHPEVAELDINPLLADADGVVALDARVRLQPASAPGSARLAIRPYPSELEERVPVPDREPLLLRPIRPEDEPALQAAFARLTPEEIRLRFFIPLKTLSHVTAARFTQIDYDREMALVLCEPGVPGEAEIYGVVSLAADPDGERGEYAILVRGDVTGMGFGPMLMRRIIDYGRARGLREIFGDVLRDNKTMLKLCRVLGFHQHEAPDDPGLVRVVLTFDTDPKADPKADKAR